MEENENNIGHYSVIPTRILFNENLKPNVKLLYGAITSLANKEGYCYASNNYFGEKFKVDPKTISSWIKELRELNYVVVEIIRNELENSKVNFHGMCKNVTASFGIAFYPEERRDINKLIKLADDLLYECKKQGKNKVLAQMILN